MSLLCSHQVFRFSLFLLAAEVPVSPLVDSEGLHISYGPFVLWPRVADGKWHTDEEGAPFSSKLFQSICTQVWQKPDCDLTAEQVTWTCLVVRFPRKPP